MPRPTGRTSDAIHADYPILKRQGMEMAILCEGDPILVNRYSVIAVNPDKHPHVHHEAAQKFAAFLLSPEIQKKIADFGKDRYRQPLFFVGAPQNGSAK